MKSLFFLAIALAPFSLSAASLMSLDLDPAKTEIRFTLHDVLHTVHGTFQLKEGHLGFDPDSGKASGEIVVDVTSGASGSEARDQRMHKNILQSRRFPDATFTPDHVDGKLALDAPSQVDVHGIFHLHGVDHDLTLHFQVERSGSAIIASTHFTIPYVQWGLKDPSNFLLKVDKTVEMDIKTVIAGIILNSA
ncbi:MAG TPA: YceI family protein [Bryobacteraceae bacterium]|nr:YceI family protein [Bryobacteraceae bacterium]